MGDITRIKPDKSFIDNNIDRYMHCQLCMDEMPGDTSPKDWSMTQTGFTESGIQVWCNRHDCNIIHIDFEGVKHPADWSRPA